MVNKMLSAKQQIPNVKKVILVAAGKGGVGKSTVASLLAMQLSDKGYKTGILDADIYGPSIPTIFSIEDEMPQVIDENFIPVQWNNIEIMSIGFLLEAKAALAWRGPILSKALNKILFSTKWNNLDYLIVDMPPGTGDVHISIAQKCDVSGAVIVTTPDKLARADVERAIDLYNKTSIPIVGIVENMSYFKAGLDNISVFGHNHADDMAKARGVSVIAKLPLIPNLSEHIGLYNHPDLQIEFEI